MISTEKLSVIYKSTKLEALKEASIYLPRNNVTCVIGPNASGKTTLLKAIGDIIDYKGMILINNQDVKRLGRALRKMLAYASTVIKDDLLAVRVKDLLLASRYPVSRGLFDTEEDLEEVQRVAKIMRVEHLLDRKIGELSSGELQRVVVAATLIRRPSIVLLDEPDSHLDIAAKPWLSNLLRDISKECTVVITTHDVIFALNTCDYFVVISKGRVIFQGYYEELVKSPAPLEDAYGVKFISARSGSRTLFVPLYIDQPTEITKRG